MYETFAPSHPRTDFAHEFLKSLLSHDRSRKGLAHEGLDSARIARRRHIDAIVSTFAMSFSLSAKQNIACARVGKTTAVAKRQNVSRVVKAAAASADVPDMGKRNVMNLLLVGAIGLPATSLIGGYAYFFVPPRCVRDR